MICLPPQAVDKFKQALVAGKIKPEELANMTSEARHKFFSDIIGEGGAKSTNALFESKMLLKNQQQGYLTWAKKVAGVSPEIRRDLISRISKMDKFLNPAEEKLFLKDLAETKLGISVTAKEAKLITDYSVKLQELTRKRRSDGTFPSEADRMAFGRAKVAMGSYLSDLKNESAKLSLKDQAKHPLQLISKTAGISKSLKATLDNSALFRQGWKTVWTNPNIWRKNAAQSFVDISRQLGGKNVMDEVKAEVVSRPNADAYSKMKLAVGNVEEEFPSTLPEKIPGFGRLYKSSETAYTAFLYRTRADIADKYLEVAKKSGVDITDKKELEAIGKLVNSLTGRGDLGRLEGKAADTMNNVFFSARFLKSNIDTLTAHQLQKDVTPFVRRQAAKNLVKVIAGSASVLAIADTIMPGSVEKDPTSSDFGKIRVGNTRFDVTGGQAGLVVLAMQTLEQQKKSATTGIISKFGNGYGSQNGFTNAFDFFSNKLSPAGSLVKDLMKQEDFKGNPLTVAGEAKNLFAPLPITTAIDTHNDPHAANGILVAIADGLGISTSTYGKSDRSENNLKPQQQAFQKAVGNGEYTKANDDYNKRLDNFLMGQKGELAKLDNDTRKATITAAKQKIQKSIYSEHNFKPPKVDLTDSTKKQKRSILSKIK